MLALVTRNASGENTLRFTSEDRIEVHRWMRTWGMMTRPGEGWCNDDGWTGAIYFDNEPGAKWRGVIWIK